MLNKSKLEAELKRFDTMLKNLQKSKESTDKNIKTTIKQIKENDDAIKLKRNLLSRLHNDLEDKSLSYIDIPTSGKLIV